MKLNSSKIFYVYEWYDVDTDIPFYIGKGKNTRMYDTRRSNKFLDFYNTHNCNVRKVYDNLNETEAFVKEYELTLNYLKKGIRLVNQRLGNCGGYTHTEEAKLKISKASKEHWKDKSYRDKLLLKIRHPKKDTSNMKMAQSSEYVKLKQRLSHLNKIPYNKGIKMPKQYCAKMKEVLNRPDTKKKMSISNNSNKPIIITNTITSEQYTYYNINEFIKNQNIINNHYKDKRNLWRYIRTHNYKYNEFEFKEM